MRQLQLTITGNTVDRLRFHGLLLGVYLEYVEGANQHSASTDVTVFRQVGTREDTLLTVSNSNTHAMYPLAVQLKDSTGTAISGQYRPPAIDGECAVRVQGGNASGQLKAYFTVLDNDPRGQQF